MVPIENHRIFTSYTPVCLILLLQELVTKIASIRMEQDKVITCLCGILILTSLCSEKTSPEAFEAEWGSNLKAEMWSCSTPAQTFAVWN